MDDIERQVSPYTPPTDLGIRRPPLDNNDETRS